MKISEFRARENYDENLKNVLSQCLKYDRELDGYALETAGNQGDAACDVELEPWFEHPFFSVYVSEDFCAKGRRYLRAQYRYTPHWIRRFLQAPAVELLSSGPGFRKLLKPAFTLPKDARAAYQMWMPGNHRFRKFDFDEGIVRVFPKSGFSIDGIRREIDIRTNYSSKFLWMFPILKTSADGNAFEEPLLNTCAFNREPNMRRRRAGMSQILQNVREIHTVDVQELNPSEYLDIKREQFEEYRDRVHKKFAGLAFNVVELLWREASRVIQRQPSVRISLTHGDFQPGNVLMAVEDAANVWFIDWEDAGVRASVYDAMTWALNSRFSEGISERVRAFEGISDGFEDYGCSVPAQVALWVIEEWIWQLESSSREGIERLPSSLSRYFLEANKILEVLRAM